MFRVVQRLLRPAVKRTVVALVVQSVVQALAGLGCVRQASWLGEQTAPAPGPIRLLEVSLSLLLHGL